MWLSGKLTIVSGQFSGITFRPRSHTSADRGVTPAAHGKSPIFLAGERLCILHVFDGILYVLTTERIRHDVPAKYGTKSTGHRYHLEPREKEVSRAIVLDLLRSALHRYSVRLKRRIGYLKAIVALVYKILQLY